MAEETGEVIGVEHLATLSMGLCIHSVRRNDTTISPILMSPPCLSSTSGPSTFAHLVLVAPNLLTVTDIWPAEGVNILSFFHAVRLFISHILLLFLAYATLCSLFHDGPLAATIGLGGLGVSAGTVLEN